MVQEASGVVTPLFRDIRLQALLVILKETKYDVDNS